MMTTIGIPKEIKPQENRVSMTPSAVAELIALGHSVVIQASAGIGAGFPDDLYLNAGATIVASAEEVFSQASLIIKVKEPLASETALLKPHHTLFTYLHLAANLELTHALAQSGCTAIAYESISVNRKLPLLEPMSEIAGRMAPLVGAYHLANHLGGRGSLLTSAPGVPPSRTVILGGGTAGLNAARIASGMGSDVFLLEIDPDRIRYIEATFPHIHTVHSSASTLADLLPHTDLLIGAILIPGAKAPKLITRSLLQLMPRSSVMVDIAIDQGGCAETSHPTTHQQPTFIEENVIHYCVANMPGAFAHTSTLALSNATLPWIRLLAQHDLPTACSIRHELASGINTLLGQITYEPVAQAHQLAFTPASSLLA